MGLFGWLKSLIRRDERRIFSYWNGGKRVFVDPVPTWYALNYADDISLEKEMLVMEGGSDADAFEAMVRVDPLIRRVFSLKPFSQGGPTTEEAVQLLADFSNWIGEVKKNGNGPPILPAPTESPSLETSTTNAGSDSGQTPSESKSENPSGS